MHLYEPEHGTLRFWVALKLFAAIQSLLSVCHDVQAPEIFRRSYSDPVDTWAIGVTLYW